MTWRFVDAHVIGTSHIDTGAACQDRCSSTVVKCSDGAEVLVAVVSDGAGSALLSEIGAESVCHLLHQYAFETVSKSSDLDRIDETTIRSWFLEVRDHLREKALSEGRELREYAATAVMAIISDHQAVCIQLGDGGIVLRSAADRPFEIAIWPEEGEYANQTFFVTDENAAEKMTIKWFDSVRDVILFSDGLQRLALEQTTRTAFAPFFEPLVATIRTHSGSHAELRNQLISYLSSPQVNARTDDDKSLAIASKL